MTHYLDAGKSLQEARGKRDPSPGYAELGRSTKMPLSTVRHHLTTENDMKLGTFIKLWKSLGYNVTIWCEGEAGETAYIFDDQRKAKS